MNPRRRADVDDHSRLLVFHAEVGSCCADQFEGRCSVDGEHCVPLFIRHLDHVISIHNLYLFFIFPFYLSVSFYLYQEKGKRKEEKKYLMNNPVPRKPSIIDNNMDLPTPKLRRLLDQLRDVRVVEHVAGDGQRAVGRCAVDGGGYCVCLVYYYSY